MACCPGILAGPVSMIVTSSENGFGTRKFETEGDLTVKPLNYTLEDRSDGRGGRKNRNNSYVEGTITLTRGIFATELALGGGNDLFNDDNQEIADLFRLCNANISLVTDCGDVWEVTGAFFSQEGTFNAREGTAGFRFSSPFEIVESNGRIIENFSRNNNQIQNVTTPTNAL